MTQIFDLVLLIMKYQTVLYSIVNNGGAVDGDGVVVEMGWWWCKLVLV